MKSIRIGAGAGFAYDRLEPALELLRDGCLDYLCFECLGERTTAFAQLEKMHNPELGYNELLEYRFDKLLDIYRETGATTKIITNMGAANPLAAAGKIAEMARVKGVHKRIAAVTGDDVLDKLDRYMELPCMETAQPLSQLRGGVLSANAYIGCAPIVKALGQGADIVVTGRASDPALVLGPAVYEFQWAMDDWDRLGAGTIAGHLMECAGQITGGYFADPGYKDVPELWRLGFPIGILHENGDLIVTKSEASGGCVTEQTVKEQILYEIQNPGAYLTPDCIADITQARVISMGRDKVLVTGVLGHPKTGLLKVNVGYRDCYIGEGEISYGGAGALNRARLAAEIVEKRLALCGVPCEELRVDIMGLNALFGDKVSAGMTRCEAPEYRVRVAARTRDIFAAKRVAYEVESLLCCGPAAGGGARRSVREVVSLASVLIDEAEITTAITMLEA